MLDCGARRAALLQLYCHFKANSQEFSGVQKLPKNMKKAPKMGLFSIISFLGFSFRLTFRELWSTSSAL